MGFVFFGGGGGEVVIFGPGCLLGIDFCHHSIIPVTWISGYPPPRIRLLHKGRALAFCSLKFLLFLSLEIKYQKHPLLY